MKWAIYHEDCQGDLKVSNVLSKVRISWWRHNMEPISTWLALCEGNSPVTGGFSSPGTINAWLWNLLWYKPRHILEQTIELLVIGDAIMLSMMSACLYVECTSGPLFTKRYSQISWNLEAARLEFIMFVSLWNFTHLGSAAAEVPVKFQSDWKKSKLESHNFENTRNLAVRRPSAYWIEALVSQEWFIVVSAERFD